MSHNPVLSPTSAVPVDHGQFPSSSPVDGVSHAAAPVAPRGKPGKAASSMNGRERVLAHLAGEAVDRLPLMPITMQLASDLLGVRYRDYETDYRLLAEGQIRTAEAYGFDYVNTMSDPGREAADCGARLEYFDNQPAAIVEDAPLLADRLDLVRLKQPDPLGGGRMHNGIRAVASLRERVGRDLLVEGWIEGPCAEGADLRGLNNLMLDFFDDAAFVHDLFGFCVEMGLRFAKAQIEAGADLIGIGDAAVSLVGPRIYEEFIWSYERRLIEGIHAMGGRTRLHICGNTRFCLSGMGRLGCHVVDLDSLSPLREARTRMGDQQILLGNMNPVATLRNSTPEMVHAAIEACHGIAGNRFIVGAGCEVPRDTPPANLHALRDYAQTHQP
ncbi:MAG: uroporphyrinogen decarboxylase family protein [Verrucomicrobiales bacterium]|nr:uroporphyrinogen decarboxylase family protein [Verrucomicrobiales bacterium]